jgi:hypothetical protein
MMTDAAGASSHVDNSAPKTAGPVIIEAITTSAAPCDDWRSGRIIIGYPA